MKQNESLFILAGGLATRLGALASETPKYLMEVVDGKRFADIHLDWVKKQGFQSVVLCVGHLGEKIQSYCGSGDKYGLNIEYSFDGPTRLGTGGAILQALKRFPAGEFFAVTYGDTLLDLSAEQSLSDFRAAPAADLFLYVYKNDVAGHVCNADFSTPAAKRSGPVKYSKKSPKADWAYIDYGFMWIRGAAYLNFASNFSQSKGEAFDLADFQESASSSGRLIGQAATKRFFEIGSPAALEEFRKFKG